MTDCRAFDLVLQSHDDGDKIGERLILLADNQSVPVGRASDRRNALANFNNLLIDNPIISEKHAEIVNLRGQISIKPVSKGVGKKCSVIVNGHAVAETGQLLETGCVVQFGVRFELDGRTYLPARYTVFIRPPGTFTGSTSTKSSTSTAPELQSQESTGIKKGYGYTSSFATEDSNEELDMSDASAGRAPIVEETNLPAQEGESSLFQFAQTSSEESGNEFDCKSAESNGMADRVAAISADEGEDDHCAPCQGDGRTSNWSVQRPGSANMSTGKTGAEWGQCPEMAIYPVLFAADQTPRSTLKANEPRAAQNSKMQRFSNSIVDLCEPSPSAGPSLGENARSGSTANAVDNVAGRPAGDAVLHKSTTETGKIPPSSPKRTAAEAALDVDSLAQSAGTTTADQNATPEQMAGRRIARFPSRVFDFGFGTLIGGAATFAMLAAIGEGV